MAKAWLKMIGTVDRPCPERYARPHVDFVRKPRRMRLGDSMVLYSVGGRKRIFALAQVSSEPYQSGQERWPYRVDISYLANLPASAGVPIEEVNTTERDLRKSIRQASFVELQWAEFERAAAMLREKREAFET